jgi:asparagine synthase (glutamine-hydrolysing)
VNDSFEAYVDKYYGFWQRMLDDAEREALFAPVWGEVADVSTRDIFRDVLKPHEERLDSPEGYINHSLYFEAKTFLHGLLVVEDKLSMAHGLETRVPFLDNDLVDFAMQVPVRLKLNNLADVIRINENDPGDKTARYFSKTSDGKQILRDVMGGFIPEGVAKAEKQGFSAPDASWFKGESIDFVRGTLMNGKARIYDYLDRQTVHRLLGEHLNGAKNRRLLIWSLLSFEQFLGTLERA